MHSGVIGETRSGMRNACSAADAAAVAAAPRRAASPTFNYCIIAGSPRLHHLLKSLVSAISASKAALNFEYRCGNAVQQKRNYPLWFFFFFSYATRNPAHAKLKYPSQ